MKTKPDTSDAVKLFRDGALALARMEHDGIRIDTDYLTRVTAETKDRIRDLDRRLRSDRVYAVWRKRFGEKSSLDSPDQLAAVVFGDLGYESKRHTEKTGRAKADESNFNHVDLPFVRDYFQMKKLKKAISTNLNGIANEVVNGFLHPVFNLHTVRTYRSSASDPNSQNFPVRNPELASLVRGAFVPRKGRQLVEIDYSGVEVRVSACYNKDPVLIRYIEDRRRDMHRDMAAECFLLEEGEVTKQARYAAKNQFVFPQFYGSYYLDCAMNLWESIAKLKLATVSGTPLYDHLRAKGITRLGQCDERVKPQVGTFEFHIQEVEKRFWNERFSVYNSWKRRWYESYLTKGYFNTYTGFKLAGVMKRNDVLNYAVQASAFHCLLWSLVRIQRWLRKNKMKSLLCLQIHDSLLADVVPSELPDFVHACKRIMTEELRKFWDWIIVPIDVEVEVSPIDGSWHEKKESDL